MESTFKRLNSFSRRSLRLGGGRKEVKVSEEIGEAKKTLVNKLGDLPQVLADLSSPRSKRLKVGNLLNPERENIQHVDLSVNLCLDTTEEDDSAATARQREEKKGEEFVVEKKNDEDVENVQLNNNNSGATPIQSCKSAPPQPSRPNKKRKRTLTDAGRCGGDDGKEVVVEITKEEVDEMLLLDPNLVSIKMITSSRDCRDEDTGRLTPHEDIDEKHDDENHDVEIQND